MLLPAIAAGKLGDENRGFALGLLPGLLHREKSRRKGRDGKEATPEEDAAMAKAGMKKGGGVKMAKGGYVRAADGLAKRGKTKGKMC